MHADLEVNADEQSRNKVGKATQRKKGNCEKSEFSEKNTPADLQAVVDAWPALPDAVKQGILSIVRGTERS